MAPSHVLVALDGSALGETALAEALDIFDCRVTLLNVVTALDSSMSEGGVLEADDGRRETAQDRAEQILSRAREQAADAGRNVETAVETGDPSEAILAFVETSDVDHVVLGSHSTDGGGLPQRLLGTVATTVVSEASVTVTVVR